MNNQHAQQRKRVPIVLSIGGFDGVGGAGIQADSKTISALGCHAMNVLTALPVQNTRNVGNIHRIPDHIIREQLQTIFEDIYPDTIKIGMVHNRATIKTIANFIKDYTGKIIIDPVLSSTNGHALTEHDVCEALIQELFPLATLITPNLPEISILTSTPVNDIPSMIAAGTQFLDRGMKAILIKGGHLESDTLTSLFMQPNAENVTFSTRRINSRNTRGTGCTLASAIASHLALGSTLTVAIKESIRFVDSCIRSSIDLDLGEGNGCLNHFHNPKKLVGIK